MPRDKDVGYRIGMWITAVGHRVLFFKVSLNCASEAGYNSLILSQ